MQKCHTANTPAATFPISLEALGTRSTIDLNSSDHSGLTTTAISVSGVNPFFNTATPIDPIKPSKFSRKKPGWRILPQHHVSTTILLGSCPVLTSNSVPCLQALYSDSRCFSWLYATVLRCLRISGPSALRSNRRTSLPHVGGRHLRGSTKRLMSRRASMQV